MSSNTRASDDESSAVSAPPTTQLESVLVQGSVPGPGLWEVRNGEHSLWLIGYVSPMPDDLQWQAEQTRAVLDQAEVVLSEPGVAVGAKIGFWSGISMLPKALRMRRNPDHQKLQDVLPPETYSHWQHLKWQYLGNSKTVERWRPIFAADRLLDTAIRRNDLTQDNAVSQAVMDWAKQRDIPILSTTLKLKVEDPKDLLRDYSKTQLDDLACFESTLDWLERDLELMRQRANAWAVGDVEKLQTLLVSDPRSACMKSFMESSLMQGHGVDNVKQRVFDTWLAAADKALNEHSVSFGVLPMKSLIGKDKALVLDALAARGYTVIAPE